MVFCYVANEILSSLKNIYKRIYITGTSNSVLKVAENSGETSKNRAVHSDTIIERGLCPLDGCCTIFYFIAVSVLLLIFYFLRYREGNPFLDFVLSLFTYLRYKVTGLSGIWNGTSTIWTIVFLYRFSCCSLRSDCDRANIFYSLGIFGNALFHDSDRFTAVLPD